MHVASLRIDDEDLGVRIRPIVKGDPFAVGRPPGCTGVTAIESQLLRVSTIRVAPRDLAAPRAHGLEHDVSSIRGELRRIIGATGSDDSGLRNNWSASPQKIGAPD